MAKEIKLTDIKQIVKELISESLSINSSTIKDSSRLREDLGVDSFGAAELFFAIKDKFSIEIPVEDAKNIKKVEDITKYIISKMKGQNSNG